MPNEKSNDTPIASTISELESELSLGVPSSLATPHAETVGERLKRIYPEHYVTIITEMNRVDGPERTAQILNNHSYEGTLRRCFIWERSQQGYDFWAILAKRET